MIGEMNRLSKNIKKQAVHLGIDVPLLMVVIALSMFGIVMVYSSSWDFSLAIYGSASLIFIRQLTWLFVGVGVVIFISMVDYHYWRRFAVPMMLITLSGLFYVLIINEVRLGAVRTLNEGSYMPSELAKLVTIIYLSIWLYSKRNQMHDVKLGLVPLAFIIGSISGLIMLQPDLSAAATVVLIGGFMFFLAGGDLKQIAIMLIVTMLVGWLVVQLHPTGSARMASYLEGIKDPTEASYHVRRSLEAIIRGGVFGLGIGKSEIKFTGLPVPPTDSIFAVVSEETGLFGSGSLLFLYVLLLWRGMVIAKRSPDMLGTLLAAGLTFWIVLEALINMAVMVGLMPFAGNALPFISAGGSNLLVTLTAIGILMNISRVSKKKEIKEGSRRNASDDKRRRQRRRRVSRARRIAGAR